MAIDVLITDDHLIVREGLRLILETVEEIRIVGEAADGREALSAAAALNPDVILMDLRMPGMGGIEAIEALAGDENPPAVIILTTFNEDELMLKGLQAGAVGFLLKDTDSETLIRSIRAAARGESLLGADIMRRLVARTGPAPEPAEARDEANPLSPRELQVLQAAARGERSKEIAWALKIGERTVKAHLSSIYNKLGVDSRSSAVAEAMRRGLI